MWLSQNFSNRVLTVFPAYVAFRLRTLLSGPCPENIIEAVSTVESLGNSRYAVVVTARNGARHRVTVEALDG